MMVAVVAHWLVGLILLVIHILSHTLKCQHLLFSQKKSEKIGDVKNTLFFFGRICVSRKNQVMHLCLNPLDARCKGQAGRLGRMCRLSS